MEYQYTNINPTNVGTIQENILASTMTDKTVENVNWNSGDEIVRITFTNTLSGADKTLLDAVVAGADPAIKEEAVEIILQEGKDKRLKWKGYSFNAVAGQSTNYDLTMPFDGHIQGGLFHGNDSKTGDELSFIILPGVVGYEFAYIDAVPITKNETFAPKEQFGMTANIPVGTPMRIVYNNTDSVDKLIVFKVAYRIDA